jgi:hypothetical protein
MHKVAYSIEVTQRGCIPHSMVTASNLWWYKRLITRTFDGASLDNSLVERALDDATEAEAFAGIMETLEPHATIAAS